MVIGTAAATWMAIAASVSPMAHVLEIAPTLVELERSHPIGSLRLVNDSKVARTYELSTYAWSQENGEDVLTPDSSLIVTPPIVTLLPDEQAIIRMGLLSQAPDGAGEQSYRLRINDISPGDTGQGGSLHFRMAFLVPLFVPASNPDDALLIASAASIPGTLCVNLNNQGNTYQKLVAVGDKDNPTNVISLQQYVLPGSQATVCAAGLSGVPADRLIASLAPTYSSPARTVDLQSSNAQDLYKSPD